MKRREFIGNSITGAVALMLFSRNSLAEWPRTIMEADSMDVALGSDGKGEKSDKIKIKAPEVAENGAVVPITVDATELGVVDSIDLLIDTNPRPLAARFKLAEGTAGIVSTRAKMAKTGNAVAVVKAGGKIYHAERAIKVTIGGCGG